MAAVFGRPDEGEVRTREVLLTEAEENMTLDYIDMDIDDVTELTLVGRITLGQGVQRLREAVESVLARGRRRILLNFDEVFYVDSSGLGELVNSLKKVREAGGQIKLMKLNQINRDLLQVTRICTLFEVFADEDSALESFKQPAPATVSL